MSNTRYSTLIFAAVIIAPRPPPYGFETRGAGSISHPHALSTSQFDHHSK